MSSTEAIKAQTAKPTEDTIFGKIARKEIKVDLLYEDEQVSTSFIFCILEKSSFQFSVWHFMISVNKHQLIF